MVVGLAAGIALAASRGSSTASGGNTAGTAAGTDPTALVGTLTGVSSDTAGTVGKGSATGLPKPIDADDLTADGKPLVLYVGAEYCPFCAAQRWAMVQALSR